MPVSAEEGKLLPTAAAAIPGSARGSHGEENRKEIDAFFNGPVRTLSFEIEPQQLERLKRDERNYVEATMNDGDKVYKHVALKLKGGQGSFQHVGGKPGLTLNFDKFKGAKRYCGMKRFHLNNAAQDPTYLNELIAGEIVRAKLVCQPPAAATRLVKLNDRDLGLYVLKEAATPKIFSRSSIGTPAAISTMADPATFQNKPRRSGVTSQTPRT